MNRTEALERLARDKREVPPGQKYAVDYFKPEDAPGLSRLFYAVYGDGYPIDTFYIPERLIEENRCGNIRSAVARTENGDIVAHSALYRSSPPNPHLYEWGLGLTLPSYRSGISFFRTNQLLLLLVGQQGIYGFFGEAVCNHMTTQKMSTRVQCIETALEPALMPAEAYAAEQSAQGRVGCLIYARIARDCRRALYLPELYRRELDFLLDGLSLDRELLTAEAPLPGGALDLEVTRFDFAGVARCTIKTPGDRLSPLIALEQALRNDRYALVQLFIDLGQAWSGALITLLRNQGYRLGGLLPAWFGSDGLLMQKHFADPDFDGLQIFSDRGRKVVEMVRSDMQREKR